jgi:Transposase DDE domain
VLGFLAFVHDLCVVLRLPDGRTAPPSAAILDSRTRPSTLESGPRAGDDGAKRKRGCKVHMAVDTLAYLWVFHVTAANAQERTQVEQLAAQVPEGRGMRSRWPLSIGDIPITNLPGCGGAWCAPRGEDTHCG